MSRRTLRFTASLVKWFKSRNGRIFAAVVFLAVLLTAANLLYPRTTLLTVAADGQETALRTSQKTVEKALLENGIKLRELDRVEPERDAPVTDGMRIAVVRVDEKLVQTEKALAFATEVKRDNNLPTGEKKTVQTGREGKEVVTVKETYENNQLVKQEMVGQEVLAAPVAQITALGTGKIASRGGTSFRYKTTVTMLSTAYGPGPEDNGKWAGGPTADGIHYVERGVAAVDPNVIPLGTKLYVEGYGFAVAADTGGAIKGNRIDLAFNTRQEALEYGMKDVKVYILE